MVSGYLSESSDIAAGDGNAVACDGENFPGWVAVDELQTSSLALGEVLLDVLLDYRTAVSTLGLNKL